MNTNLLKCWSYLPLFFYSGYQTASQRPRWHSHIAYTGRSTVQNPNVFSWLWYKTEKKQQQVNGMTAMFKHTINWPQLFNTSEEKSLKKFTRSHWGANCKRCCPSHTSGQNKQKQRRTNRLDQLEHDQRRLWNSTRGCGGFIGECAVTFRGFCRPLATVTTHGWTQHSEIWSWSPPADNSGYGLVASHNITSRAKGNIEAAAVVKRRPGWRNRHAFYRLLWGFQESLRLNHFTNGVSPVFFFFCDCKRLKKPNCLVEKLLFSHPRKIFKIQNPKSQSSVPWAVKLISDVYISEEHNTMKARLFHDAVSF